METGRITHMDALSYLKSLPDNAVNCMITSPPYWGLRDYGVSGQLGLEPTLTEYLDNMTAIFTEARRVLREDGVLFLNMGDGYANTNCGGGSVFDNGRNDGRESYEGDKPRGREATTSRSTVTDTLKPKDLIGQPWRLAFRLQDDGWWLRSDIIWHKPNPMPESVTDRPTKSHEYVFLMTKSPRYWYDSYAVREPHTDKDLHLYQKNTKHGVSAKNYTPPEKDGIARKSLVMKTHNYNPAGRNKRTVWTVATHPFPESHFATFPPKLIEPMVLSGCPPKVCSVCGAPWERGVEPTEEYEEQKQDKNAWASGWGNAGYNRQRVTGARSVHHAQFTNLGFRPTCPHTDAPTVPGIILDMFMGAGTTALVATQHGRRWAGCELNPEYIEIAMRRLSAVQVNMFSAAGL